MAGFAEAGVGAGRAGLSDCAVATATREGVTPATLRGFARLSQDEARLATVCAALTLILAAV